MSSVVSKNLFELLGNDPEDEPQAPVQPIDKPAQRAGKRNAVGEAPVKDSVQSARGSTAGRGGRGGRRDNFTGSEKAFQDRDAGRTANRGKPVDDGLRFDRHSDRLGGGRVQRGGGFDGRGGRGGAGGRGGRGGRDDRHSRTAHSDSTKQAGHGWGEETGSGEWNDEKAGQALAWEEEKKQYDSWVEPPVNAEGETPATENNDQAGGEPEPEPEPDKTKSFADYLAEQAEKKLQLGGDLAARKPNEGAAKKQPQGKELAKSEDDEYFAGTGGKQRRERERKEKNTLLLDHDMLARERESGRGGRGGGRGRGTGGFRGDGRARGRGRGEGRGRGGRGGSSPNVTDKSAFPSLGA